jgi:hypothetical protein
VAFITDTAESDFRYTHRLALRGLLLETSPIAGKLLVVRGAFGCDHPLVLGPRGGKLALRRVGLVDQFPRVVGCSTKLL